MVCGNDSERPPLLARSFSLCRKPRNEYLVPIYKHSGDLAYVIPSVLVDRVCMPATRQLQSSKAEALALEG